MRDAFRGCTFASTPGGRAAVSQPGCDLHRDWSMGSPPLGPFLGGASRSARLHLVRRFGREMTVKRLKYRAEPSGFSGKTAHSTRSEMQGTIKNLTSFRPGCHEPTLQRVLCGQSIRSLSNSLTSVRPGTLFGPPRHVLFWQQIRLKQARSQIPGR